MKKAITTLILLVGFIQPVWAAAPKVGDAAPNFELQSVSGDTLSLSQYKGKVVLVGMFHICVPCMNQAMEFNRVRQALPEDKVVILGINTSGDPKKDVTDYLQGFPEMVTFPYLLDPGMSVNKAYVQRDMPTVLIIDQAGILRARSPGVGADQLISYLKKLL